ncbi:ABC transporter ATP-binding protein [Zhaonella formicivorans]|uniref:ABC transporter ATP-binding protein n=1 Tax=Zhaonella formicivorans TaxID=2528593 RepID=UPI0010E709AC|nr:ABC transporter ATP-binding protein [Zhaonella formicivorans]
MPFETGKYIEINNLKVEYIRQRQRVTALEGVDLILEQGQTGVIIGPSGCGKSTLLHVLAGLKTEYEGQVLINGKFPGYNMGTALILQDYGLLPWKTVWSNVALGLKVRKLPKAEIQKTVNEILQRFSLMDLRDRFPSQLSGGQRQRVAIARALALKPELLLMDEPFSSLDALTREELQDFLLRLWENTGMSIILVTHSIEEAVFLGQRIFVMSASPGTVIAKIDNKLAGDRGLRGKKEFYQLCSYLRSLLKGRKRNEQISEYC